MGAFNPFIWLLSALMWVCLGGLFVYACEAGAEVCQHSLYCNPEACLNDPPPPMCGTAHDSNGDGVVGGPDFAQFLTEFACHAGQP